MLLARGLKALFIVIWEWKAFGVMTASAETQGELCVLKTLLVIY